MKIDKKDLMRALYKAQGVAIKGGQSAGILSHALVEVDGDTLSVFASNYENSLIGTYPCDHKGEPVRFGLNVKTAYDAVKTLPDGAVSLSVGANHFTTIKGGSARFRVAGLPAEDFPQPPTAPDDGWIQVKKRTLVALIDRTVFSVSRDETRPAINGALLRVEPEDGDLRLTMVSTDGHRLSKATASIEDGSADAAEAIIHHSALSALLKVMEGPDEDVWMCIGGRREIHFSCDESSFSVRTLEETFPDFNKVIPNGSAIRVDLDKRELAQALRRIGTMTSAKQHVILWDMEPGKLTLTSSDPQHGEARDVVEAEYMGDKVLAGFNYRYLLDVLGVISGDVVTFGINDQFSPGLLTSADDPGSMFVVMPMRV